MVSIPGLGCALLPVTIVSLTVYLVARDKWTERRDRRIQEKRNHLTLLFKEVADPGKVLTRIYFQSYKGEGYPYNLFMIEYRRNSQTIETIWLPVDQFLNADDSKTKQVLSRELAQPGEHTIPDWTVALIDYVMRHRQIAGRKKTPLSNPK